MFTDDSGNLNGHNHAPNFGRKVDGCPRCQELSAGTEPRQPRVVEVIRRRETEDAARSRAIREHDCVASRCSSVCTAFQW